MDNKWKIIIGGTLLYLLSKKKVRHATNPPNMAKILKSGYIQKGSYITDYSIENMPAKERAPFLSIDDDKGKCFCVFDIRRYALKRAPNGAYTVGGAPQKLIRRDWSINPKTCCCDN